MAKGLDLPMDRIFVNLDRYGNTSAASVPLALAEAVDTGRVKVGDKLVFVAFGAGFTSGRRGPRVDGRPGRRRPRRAPSTRGRSASALPLDWDSVDPIPPSSPTSSPAAARARPARRRRPGEPEHAHAPATLAAAG